MYPETIQDYQELESAQRKFSRRDKIGNLLNSPVFIIGIAILWGIVFSIFALAKPL